MRRMVSSLRTKTDAKGAGLAVALGTLVSMGWGCGGTVDGGGDAPGSGGVWGTGGAPAGAGGAPGGSGGGGLSASGGLGIDLGADDDTDIPALPAVELSWRAWLDEYGRAGPASETRAERPADVGEPFVVGTPGWRDSSAPLCTSTVDVETAEVWADSAGVAVLSIAPECASAQGVLDAHGDPCGPFGSELWYNDGTGWEWLLGLEVSDLHLSGIPGGDLWLAGPGILPVGRHGALGAPWPARADEGVFGEPEPLDQSPPPTWGPVRAGVVPLLSSTLEGDVYALVGWPGRVSPVSLNRFDEAGWTALNVSSEAISGLFVVDGVAHLHGESAIYRAAAGSRLEPMPAVPGGAYGAITGLSQDSLWAANEAGQIAHFDGITWTVIAELGLEFYRHRFWTDGQEVYFASSAGFGRVTESSVEILAQGRFDSIWGTSSQEIFLTRLDSGLNDYACDALSVYFYDGHELHRF